MTRNICAGSINHMRQRHRLQVLLNQLLTELPLNESIGSDLANITGTLTGIFASRQLKKALDKGHRKLIVATAALVCFLVIPFLDGILNSNVGRVANDNVIAAYAQQINGSGWSLRCAADVLIDVLGQIRMRLGFRKEVFLDSSSTSTVKQ